MSPPSKPTAPVSNPQAKRNRRLTPAERKRIAELCARGYQPGQVCTELATEIPHLRPFHVHDVSNRYPKLIAAARDAVALVETRKQIGAEALKLAIPEIIERVREDLVGVLPDLVTKEVKALVDDQALLNKLAPGVLSATEASALMRARMLRQNRQDVVFGVAPAKPPEPNAGAAQAHLHLHLASQWVPRRVQPSEASASRSDASDTHELDASRVTVSSPED